MSGSAFLAVFLSAALPLAYPAASPAEQSLRVAITPVLVERNVELNERLIGYIGEKMNMPITIVQRKSYQEINDLIRQKKVDVAFVCSLPYILGKSRSGMELLVVPITKGKPLYYSYAIVARDSLAKSIEDLRGKLYAYPDPLSNSGYLYPRYRLIRAGFSPDDFFNKWIQTHSHTASIEAVSDGFVDGANVDSYIYDLMSILRPALTEKTKIIERSPPFGFPPVVVRSDLPAEMKRKLKALFLTLHEDARGNAILLDMHLDGFVNGDDSLFDPVRKMYRTVSGHDAAGRR